MSGFDAARLKRLDDVMAGHVDSGDVGGVAWLAACGDDLDVGVAGVLTRGEAAPVQPRLHLPDRLDDQADRRRRRAAPGRGVPAAPRRAGRRAAAGADRPAGARRATSGRSTARRSRRSDRSRSATSSRSGSASAWTSRHRGRSRCSRRWARSNWATAHRSRRNRPSQTSGCAGWGRCRCCTSPGERWLYNIGSDVLGVLVARAAGQPLEEFLRAACVRAPGHGRHRILDRRTSTGSARATRRIPETGERGRVRRARRPVDHSPGVPVRRRRPRVDGRRLPRLRPHAARRRTTGRRNDDCCRRRPSRR